MTLVLRGQSKIMIVSEAWSEEEAKEGRPFVGSTGFILKGMLSVAGVKLEDCYVTQVMARRNHDLKLLCGGKPEALPNYPAIIKGKYIRNEFAPDLTRLYQEIINADPNIIIALGPLASWALLKSSGIKAVRGSLAPTHPEVSAILGRTFKVLPTYHPSSVARDWTLRPICINDFDKAHRHSTTQEYRRPVRHVWIEPTLNDLAEFDRRYMQDVRICSTDIETKGNQITCIGFAPSPTVSIVVPFYDARVPHGNYWATLADEMIAWQWVRQWCTLPSLFQNGMYDIHFLWRRYGIPVPNAMHDTMLLHHAYQPEMEKGLGFLGSIYTEEASWKHMGKADSLKKGE